MRHTLKLEIQYEDSNLFDPITFDIKQNIIEYYRVNTCYTTKSGDIIIKELNDSPQSQVSKSSKKLEKSSDDILLSSKLSKSIALTTKIKIL